MKTFITLFIFGAVSAQAFALELPQITFEPTTTSDGSPASRVTTQSLAETRAATGGYEISRITVSAEGRQFNISQPAQDDLVIPMILESTGLIGMQWRIASTQLDDAQIMDIQPEMDRSHNGKFIHLVSSKHLLRSEEHGQRQVQAFLAKVAYPISIRPLADPTLLPAGSDLPVRLYLGGRPVVGALLTAENKETGLIDTARSTEHGIAVVSLDDPGKWQLSFSQIPVNSDAPAAVYTALLEFTVQRGEQP